MASGTDDGEASVISAGLGNQGHETQLKTHSFWNNDHAAPNAYMYEYGDILEHIV